MRHAFTDAIYESSSIDFARTGKLVSDAMRKRYVDHALDRAGNLQETMVSRWIDGRDKGN